MDIKVSTKEYAELSLCKVLVDFTYNELKEDNSNFARRFIERYEAMGRTIEKWEETK